MSALTSLSSFEYLAIFGALAAVVVLAHVLTNKEPIGNSLLAATLAGAFGGFTAVTIASEGLLPVWTNHTTNLWGVQVWWDLLFSVGIALFLIAPRARKAGMNLPLWVLFVGTTASIGLLAMCARLFALERAAASEASAKS